MPMPNMSLASNSSANSGGSGAFNLSSGNNKVKFTDDWWENPIAILGLAVAAVTGLYFWKKG